MFHTAGSLLGVWQRIALTDEKYQSSPTPTPMMIRSDDRESGDSQDRKRQSGIMIAAAVWAGLVVFGLFRVGTYEFSAGFSGHAANGWPVQSRIAGPSDGPVLVLALHPRCPCSRATLFELKAIAAQSGPAFSCRILLYRPAGSTHAWSNTDLRAVGQSIAGVSIIDDPGGREAASFGALTSGQVLAFDSSGRLGFRGGITASRGHAGSNRGADMLIGFLSGQPVSGKIFTTPVFGCSLRGGPSERSL